MFFLKEYRRNSLDTSELLEQTTIFTHHLWDSRHPGHTNRIKLTDLSIQKALKLKMMGGWLQNKSTDLLAIRVQIMAAYTEVF